VTLFQSLNQNKPTTVKEQVYIKFYEPKESNSGSSGKNLQRSNHMLFLSFWRKDLAMLQEYSQYYYTEYQNRFT